MSEACTTTQPCLSCDRIEICEHSNNHSKPCACRQVYDAAQTRYTGRCTAPLLIDKKQKKLVSNESSDIMRMLNTVNLPGCTDVDLYPKALQSEINEINDLVYDKVSYLLQHIP